MMRSIRGYSMQPARASTKLLVCRAPAAADNFEPAMSGQMMVVHRSAAFRPCVEVGAQAVRVSRFTRSLLTCGRPTPK